MAELNENEELEKNVETEFAKCPTCGAQMIFNPKTQKLFCEHCEHSEDIAVDKNVEEIELSSALNKTQNWSNETKIFRCENCGAKVVLEKNAVARSCPFCGTTNIVGENEIAGIKPNALIPFLIDKEGAANHCKKWSKKRLFAPRSFKKNFGLDKINGVYSPCFTFDSDTQSSYYGRLGKRKTRVVGSGKNRRVETYIQYFNVKGNIAKFFDDVTISAGKQINQANLDKISPFAKDKGCVYENKFLHGFMANHYDKDINQSWKEAKDIIHENLKQLIIQKHNADVCEYLTINTTHNNVTYKYVLLPVYVGNFTFKKNLYNVYINGSTGKVTGKAPVSPLRVALTILICGAVLFGLYYLNSLGII